MQDILKLKGVQVHVFPTQTDQDEIIIDIADTRNHALQVYKSNPDFAEMIQ